MTAFCIPMEDEEIKLGPTKLQRPYLSELIGMFAFVSTDKTSVWVV